jgi:hypothetical protein
LITDPAIETSFCLMDRDIFRNPQIDFIKIPNPLAWHKPRQCHPVGIVEIICVDLRIPDHAAAALAAGPTHVCFHGKRCAIPDSAGFKFRKDGIGPLPKQRVEHHSGLLPRSDGMDDTLYLVKYIAAIEKRRRPVFLDEGRASEIQDACARVRRFDPLICGFRARGFEETSDLDLAGESAIRFYTRSPSIVAYHAHSSKHDSATFDRGLDGCGGHKFHQLDAFIKGHLDLVSERRHILAPSPIQDKGFPSKTDNASGDVDSRVSSPNDG